jgi:amidase
VAYYTNDGQATPTAEIGSVVEAAAQALREAGLSVKEAIPARLSDSRAITERYWQMSKLSGDQVEQMFMNWDRFRTSMLAFLSDYDAILCPADYRPASPHTEDHKEWRFNYTLPFSLCGWPCTVVRAGETSGGLPIGVQFASRPWREDIVLALAQQIEDALGGWKPPPF